MRYSLVQRGLIALVLVLVLVLAMAVWFSASAVVPALAGQWHLSAGCLLGGWAADRLGRPCGGPRSPDGQAGHQAPHHRGP